jgi:Helicase associated domain
MAILSDLSVTGQGLPLWQEFTSAVTDTHANLWEESFNHLQDYAKHNGDARVANAYTVDGYPLGKWVEKQRDRHTGGTLDADRERRLQARPGWTWDPRVDLWEEGFTRLLDYVERNGHARVPFSCAVDGYPLGSWVNTQRTKHAKGSLHADRERRLQDLPGWTWKALSST